ncbi:hypothetical protein RhiirA1_227450 [Rhizophagus irregularis]|uniref:Uncharacterized protein n=1 Tax=Rhizophagus irregularis TaxID=588596 RepID=A0A2N0SEK2_9GLOM|nr:hypothetical protein RhiirA1_227450 [Rhizophagus irregularis]
MTNNRTDPSPCHIFQHFKKKVFTCLLIIIVEKLCSISPFALFAIHNCLERFKISIYLLFERFFNGFV